MTLTRCNASRQLPHHTWADALASDIPAAAARARVVAWGVPLMGLLHLMLTPLLLAHLYLAAANVTTKEHFRYHSTVLGSMGGVPFPGTPFWRKYAPYDRGLVRNLRGFLRATRDEDDEGAPLLTPSGGSHELQQVRVEQHVSTPEASPRRRHDDAPQTV